MWYYYNSLLQLRKGWLIKLVKTNVSKKRRTRLKSMTLFIDELSIVVSFFTAVAIRFRAIMEWPDAYLRIYVSMLLTALIFEVVIYTFYDNKRASVAEIDPFENFFRVVKNRGMLVALSILYFYVTYRAVLTSRIVFGIFLTLSVIVGYVFRMLYRKHCIDKYGIPGVEKIYEIRFPLTEGVDSIIAKIEAEEYDCCVLLGSNENTEEAKAVLQALEKADIRTYESISTNGYRIRTGIISDIGLYATIPSFVRSDRVNILGTYFCIARLEEAVHHVITHIEDLKGKYICFSNVHTSVMACESMDYRAVLNGAALVFPDGEPIARAERLAGQLHAERVAGPDFMENMFLDTQDGKISHFFYGSTQKTLDGLQEKLTKTYPGLNIKGMYSPPFRDLTEEEDREIVKMLNDSGADIVWIGLGAPKQEKWMKAHEGMVNAVMMGVGAGFDFHGGTIIRAPKWMQRVGLEWLYRLFKDPKRLFKRYISTNIKFIWYRMFKRQG